MVKADKPEKNEKTAIIKRALLIIVFITAATVAGILIPAKPTQAKRFGFVREPRAYCMFGLSVNAPDAVLSYESYGGLIKALEGGALDAALLPAQYLDELEDDRYSVAAVVCYMNLVAVENGTSVFSIADLDGRQVVMPRSLEGMPEERMLDALLEHEGVSAQILYADDDAVQRVAQNRDYDIMVLPADGYAAVFPRGGEIISSLDLADQWRLLLGSRPPADCCLVVRNETMEQRAPDVSEMLSKIRAAVNFLRTSHKKAAVLASASGFYEDVDYIRRTISHRKFEYLDGDAKTQALEQWQSLITAP